MKIQQMQYFWLLHGHLPYSVHSHRLIYINLDIILITFPYPQQSCRRTVVLCRSIEAVTRSLGCHLTACQRYLVVYFSTYFFLKLRAISFSKPMTHKSSQADKPCMLSTTSSWQSVQPCYVLCYWEKLAAMRAGCNLGTLVRAISHWVCS